MSEFERADQASWNRLAPLHARSAFYDVQGFKAGRISLLQIEREELGDVAGKSLLHLQCHFGMDTLSWARLGAQVTGVDYAESAIELARELGREIGLDARFICTSIYDLPEQLSDTFDIVFTSYGVLCWLPDLARWGQVIAHFLKPGGVFYIVDGHPFACVFYNEKDATGLRVAYPYFEQATPEAYPCDGSYATDAELHYTSYEWPHSLSEIVNALLEAGLQIEFLHEFPYAAYQCLPFMVQGADGWWRLPEGGESVPFLFSLKAIKPGSG
ncbi:MAG: class I SAM-dependent methyltransferase [Anaerolineae bacterium]|nr:class I SAM-dependent methyltransferase [Anaerolineae bacterium]